jgi:uncharacterized protein
VGDASPGVGNADFLFYVRTPTHNEIDFVSVELGEAAIEGKYTVVGRWRSDAATVNASRWDGIMMTRSLLDTADSAAWAVPAGLLAFHVDV